MTDRATCPADAGFPESLHRRDFLTYFSGLGLSSTLLPGVLWAQTPEGQEITPAPIAEAEKLAGLEFTEEEREAMVRGLSSDLRSYSGSQRAGDPQRGAADTLRVAMAWQDATGYHFRQPPLFSLKLFRTCSGGSSLRGWEYRSLSEKWGN